MTAPLQPDLELAESPFDRLSRATRHVHGIGCDNYGPGEQAAHGRRGPDESMTPGDFPIATRALLDLVRDFAL